VRIAYSYNWFLPVGDLTQVREIIERLRQHAFELGGDAGDVKVLTGDEAQAVQPGAQVAVFFSATIPAASEGRYGLASVGNALWSWHGAVVISSAKTVGEFHAAAADLGIEVVEGYAGMVFESKKNGHGVVEVTQRSAFDWTDF
jgi:hypothetical protein